MFPVNRETSCHWDLLLAQILFRPMLVGTFGFRAAKLYVLQVGGSAGAILRDG